jgi:hypothetical protein
MLYREQRSRWLVLKIRRPKPGRTAQPWRAKERTLEHDEKGILVVIEGQPGDTVAVGSETPADPFDEPGSESTLVDCTQAPGRLNPTAGWSRLILISLTAALPYLARLLLRWIESDE